MARPKKNSTTETTSEKSSLVTDISVDNSKGPTIFQRDSDGLLKNVQYIFNTDGSIDWRAMIKDEHLFPNRSWFQSRGKDMPRTSEGLADHQLLIKLSGIKELARLRGFSDVSYKIVKCEADHVAAICRMTFIGNYETGGNAIVFEDMANATTNNTSSFATKFLETIACNRAFVRCTRNFLNVHIVGDDEMDKSTPGSPASTTKEQDDPFSPATTLKKKAKDSLNCDSFEEFKKHVKVWWQERKDGVYQNPHVKDWKDWVDINAKDARLLIGLI